MIKQDKKKNPNDYKNEKERRKELGLKKNQLFIGNGMMKTFQAVMIPKDILGKAKLSLIINNQMLS